jgi:hypothetical protein
VIAAIRWEGVLMVGALIGFGALMFGILIRSAKTVGTLGGCAIAALGVTGTVCVMLGILFAGCGACGSFN